MATSDWVREPERSNVYMVAFMRWFSGWAPRFLSEPLIWMIALYYLVHPNQRPVAASRAYLVRALGRAPGWTEVHRHIENFAHVILDRAILLSGGVAPFEIRAHGQEQVLRAHEAGRGGVLLSAHLGSFEMLRAFDRELPGLTVRYMMFPDNAETTTRILNEINPEIAAQVISLGDGQGAMLAAQEALDRGEFIAFLGDRTPRSDMRNRVEVEFLGGPVWLPTSPYMLAMMARVPLVLCFAPRLGHRSYDIDFEEIYDGSPVERTKRGEKCAELAQAYARRMEALCRRHPYNWFNFFDVWS